MSPVELLIYAASWQILADSTGMLLFITPRRVVEAAEEVIRRVPLTREEFATFEDSLFSRAKGST